MPHRAVAPRRQVRRRTALEAFIGERIIDRKMRIQSTALISLAAATLVWPASASAKRRAPSLVPPVVWQGVEYRAPLDVEHMGYAQAFELPSGRKLWETKVYQVWIVPTLEEDNQWVFISGMRVQNGKLVIRNENGKSYRLDLKTGRVEGAMRYWMPWFIAGVLVAVLAFFGWTRTRHHQPAYAPAPGPATLGNPGGTEGRHG